MTSTLDSQINGYSANGTIRASVPVSKEKPEIPNGKDGSSNPFHNFKDVPSNNNNPLSGSTHKQISNKNFVPLHIDCNPVSTCLPKFCNKV